MPQGKRGAPTLLDHLIQTAAACPGDAVLRLAGLLHDVGKLTTRRITPDAQVTFHGHAKESAVLAAMALQRLRCDEATTARVVSLIRQHMGPGTVSAKTLRRWLAEYGEAWVRDLQALQRADICAGGGGGAPWLDEAEAELERLLAEEQILRRRDLAVDGHDIMAHLGLAPGPQVGRVLAALYDYVLADPKRNQWAELLAAARQWQESGLEAAQCPPRSPHPPQPRE